MTTPRDDCTLVSIEGGFLCTALAHQRGLGNDSFPHQLRISSTVKNAVIAACPRFGQNVQIVADKP